MPQFPRNPLLRACSAASAAALLLGGCSALGIGGSKEAESSASSTDAYTVPSGMTMPTPLPTTQPTALPDIKIGMPEVTGYQQVPQQTASPTALASTSPDTQVTSRTWASANPLCTIQVDITRSSSLLLAGGDDRHMSVAWAEGHKAKLKDYADSSTEYRVVKNGNTPFTGISTDFTASIEGTKVVGRSFVRAFSATGTLVSVTHTCSGENVDQDAWNQVLGGLSIKPGDDKQWPGAATTASPTPEPSHAAYSPTPESTGTAYSPKPAASKETAAKPGYSPVPAKP